MKRKPARGKPANVKTANVKTANVKAAEVAGPKSYAAGQVEQDYGESRRENNPLPRKERKLPAPARRRRSHHETDMAIGTEGYSDSQT